MKIKFSNVLIVSSLIFFACEDDNSAEVSFLDASFDINNVSAFNETDGSISVTVEGGEPPYFYSWSNGDTTRDLSGVPAGTYDYTVIYGNGGIAYFDNLEVGQPDADSLSVDFTVTNASYHTAKDGSIILDTESISGGIEPYKLEWNNDPLDTLPFKFNLFAGTYQLTITDAGDTSSFPYQNKTTYLFTVAEPEFICGQDSIIDIDEIRYATVDIDGVCWTKSNLRVSRYSDGSSIDERYCFSVFCGDTRGAHYGYTSAINIMEGDDSESTFQGICPEGWHIPTETEWDDLAAFLSVDGNGGSGTNVKQKLLGDGSSSGFDALFTGSFGYDLNTGGTEAIFWSSTGSNQNSMDGIYYMLTEAAIPSTFTKATVNKDAGLCIRCIQD